MMTRPKQVKIVEVGPRDGLQNETQILSLEDKIQFIEKLYESGVKHMEVTSFVRADKIPQMADSGKLFNGLSGEVKKSCELTCLTPNIRGYNDARKENVNSIAIFTSVSETFNKKNINASIEESLERFRPIAVKALEDGVRMRGYVSTVFGCPYEGVVKIDLLKTVINRLLDFGVYEISLGDTIGIANPDQVKKVINEIKNHFDIDTFAMHFHDTRGSAVANILSSLDEGIEIFDSSAGGLGGCPYAKGASGNVATEDVIEMFHSMGVETGIDIMKLVQASKFILNKLNKRSLSKAYHYHSLNS